jgi:hypothetical protein
MNDNVNETLGQTARAMNEMFFAGFDKLLEETAQTGARTLVEMDRLRQEQDKLFGAQLERAKALQEASVEAAKRLAAAFR